jgi:HK97 family phage major capsid protein
MNRKSLITLLKANGYAEAVPTLETVKAHVAKLASEGVELHAADGTPINVDTVWAAKSVLTLAGDDADTALSESQRKSIIADAKGKDSPHADGEVSNRSPSRFTIGNAARKAYERKIRDGKSVFADPDQAEGYAAWVRLQAAGHHHYTQKTADIEICKKNQVEFNQQLGGALVPQVFVPQLIWLTEQYGAGPRLANVVPMGSESAAYPRKTGITAMTPMGEGSTMTVTTNSYGNVTLTAKEYGVLMSYSNSLFNDAAVNVADDIANTMAEAKAIAVDNAYFLGDGTSTYAGQVGLTAALPSGAYINGSGNSWSAITKDDFTSIMGAVQNINAARLGFTCSRQFFVQVMMRLDKATSQFKDISSGNLGGGTFMGYPVQFAQVMPITSASASRVCYFGDFTGGSMIGDRQDLTIATSEQFLFNTNSVAVRGVARFNVNIHGDGRGSTVGPIAALVTT